MRSAATLTVAYLLLILQSTVLELAPVHMAVPSFGLLVVLHVGFSPKWTISCARSRRIARTRRSRPS